MFAQRPATLLEAKVPAETLELTQLMVKAHQTEKKGTKATRHRGTQERRSSSVVISVVALGLSRTLVGMGAVVVPACHRQGPKLQPWADPVRLPMSWDSGEDSYCDHRLDATSVM